MTRDDRQRWIILFAATLLLVGCSRSRIWQVESNPEHYNGKTVTLEGTGTAQQQLPGVAWSYYQISDESGMGIWVQAQGEAPPVGIIHQVTGVVRVGVIIKGSDFRILVDATEFS